VRWLPLALMDEIAPAAPSFAIADVALGVIFLLLATAGCVVWYRAIANQSRGTSLVPLEFRESVPWTIADALILAFLSLAMEVLLVHLWANVPGEKSELLSPAAMGAASAAHLIWIALAAAYLVFERNASAIDLGFDDRKWSADARTAGLLFLAAALPVYLLQGLLIRFVPSAHPLVELVRQQGGTGVLVLASVAAVVVAPLYEEFLFRVLLQGSLEKLDVERRKRQGVEDPSPTMAPTLVASLLFALMHLGHGPDPIPLFVLSLFLGYAYRQTHRIYPSLLMHMGVNSLAVLGLWAEYLSASP
jgi:membrane protease YdiL (CAAX protease family)